MNRRACPARPRLPRHRDARGLWSLRVSRSPIRSATSRPKPQQLEAQINSNAEKLGALNEQINSAQNELDQAEADIRAADALVAAAKAKTKRAAGRGRAPRCGRLRAERLDRWRRRARRAERAGPVVAPEVQLARRAARQGDRPQARRGEGRGHRSQGRRRRRRARSRSSSRTRSRRRRPSSTKARRRSSNCRRRSPARSPRSCSRPSRNARRVKPRPPRSSTDCSRASRRRSPWRVLAAAVAVATPAGGGGGGGSAPTPPPSSGGVGAVMAYAYAQLGKPYCYAGVGPGCFDCSGLTMMAWAQAGVSMSHGSYDQMASFPRVSMGALQPGDLVFWDGHVGISVGGSQVLHAPRTGHGGAHRQHLARRHRRRPPRLIADAGAVNVPV